jgi:hypothetical protein
MFEAKKQQLLASLEQIRVRIGQISQELARLQAQEQQVIGALMLCDELMAEQGVVNSENSEPAPNHPS